jgi:hypothetical protein
VIPPQGGKYGTVINQMDRILSEIRRRLVHRKISLADAMRMIKEEGRERLTDIRLRWLEYELTGFPMVPGLIEAQPFDVPEYRRVNGTYFARTPSGVWADVSDTKNAHIASFLPVPIGIIEDLVANPLNEEVDIQLGELIPNTPVAIRLHRSQLVNIDESVRNTLVSLLDEVTAPE